MAASAHAAGPCSLARSAGHQVEGKWEAPGPIGNFKISGALGGLRVAVRMRVRKVGEETPAVNTGISVE